MLNGYEFGLMHVRIPTWFPCNYSHPGDLLRCLPPATRLHSNVRLCTLPFVRRWRLASHPGCHAVTTLRTMFLGVSSYVSLRYSMFMLMVMSGESLICLSLSNGTSEIFPYKQSGNAFFQIDNWKKAESLSNQLVKRNSFVVFWKRYAKKV